MIDCNTVHCAAQRASLVIYSFRCVPLTITDFYALLRQPLMDFFGKIRTPFFKPVLSDIIN